MADMENNIIEYDLAECRECASDINNPAYVNARAILVPGAFSRFSIMVETSDGKYDIYENRDITIDDENVTFASGTATLAHGGAISDFRLFNADTTYVEGTDYEREGATVTVKEGGALTSDATAHAAYRTQGMTGEPKAILINPVGEHDSRTAGIWTGGVFKRTRIHNFDEACENMQNFRFVD